MDVGLDYLDRFYVLDTADRLVKVFDETGQHIARLPLPRDRYSQASTAVGLSVTASGTVYLWDSLGQTLFSASVDSDSAFRRIRTVLGEAAPGHPVPIIAHDGVGVALALRRQGPNSFEDEVRLYDPDGRQKASHGPYPTASVALIRDGDDGPTHRISLPFDLADRIVWTLRPDGSLLLANSTEYRIVALHGTDTLWVLSREETPVPVTHTDRDNALVMAPSVSARESIADLIPLTKVPITGLLATDEILLVRRSTQSAHVYTAEFDIFDLSDRTYCGRLTLPTYELAGGRHTLVGRSIRSDGEVTIEAFRLAWSDTKAFVREPSNLRAPQER